MNNSYDVKALAPGAWAIEMEKVRAFLVAGDTSALLIDTGAGGVNLRAAVCECAALPLRVVNTHSHYDHISGNRDFPMQFAHPLELSALLQAGFRPNPVGDGAGFDLGGRILQVVGLPGHSPGSIGLWDAEAGLLFAGDTVASGRPVTLCLTGASLEAYIRSMGRILAMEDDGEGGTVRRIFCCHGSLEVDMDTVRQLKDCAEQIRRGELAGEPLPDGSARTLPEAARIYRLGDVALIV